MNCATAIELLEAFAAGRLGDVERRDVDAHLRSCARCAELGAILGEGAEPPHDLVRAVLSRTSGSTCGSARGRLCDHVDAQLDAVEAELVRTHLDGCEECDAMRGALERLSLELPLLAELQLDDRFVDDVLTRTLPRRTRWARWAARTSEAWQSLVRRPRLAWEGAYVATAVLMLVFGIPSSPLAGVPKKMIELARVNPVDPLRGSTSRLTSDLHAAWESLGVESALHDSGAWVASTSQETASSVAQFSESTLNRLKGLGTLRRDDASESGQEDGDDEQSPE